DAHRVRSAVALVRNALESAGGRRYARFMAVRSRHGAGRLVLRSAGWFACAALTAMLGPGPAWPEWPPTGAPVAVSNEFKSLLGVVTDGSDALFVIWEQSSEIYVQRLRSDGTITPGWPAAGRRVTYHWFKPPVLIP